MPNGPSIYFCQHRNCIDFTRITINHFCTSLNLIESGKFSRAWNFLDSKSVLRLELNLEENLLHSDTRSASPSLKIFQNRSTPRGAFRDGETQSHRAHFRWKRLLLLNPSLPSQLPRSRRAGKFVSRNINRRFRK